MNHIDIRKHTNDMTQVISNIRQVTLGDFKIDIKITKIITGDIPIS